MKFPELVLGQELSKLCMAQFYEIRSQSCSEPRAFFHRLRAGGRIVQNRDIGRLNPFLLIAALCAGTCACQRAMPVPPVPKVVTTGFPARVRVQLDAAYAEASAHPENAGASGRLGMLLHTYQQLDLAETCYRRAHLLDPKVFEWAYYLTLVEQIHGETDQAIADARAAVKLNRSSRPGRMRLAEALLQGKDFKAGRKLYEDLVKEEPDLAIYHYGLGKALAAEGSMSGAIDEYQRACQLSPIFSAARYALAMAYRETKDLDRATQELAIYKRNPNGNPPEDALMAQITALNQGGLIRAQAAQQYMAQGRPDEAVKQLETAVASDPNDEVAHANLVAAYWELKQWDKAEQHYRIAAKLNPATTSHYVFGLVMLDQKRYAEAGEAFRKALELNPRDNGANTQLGRVLELQGDLRGATRQYETALQSDPNSRATNYLLGMALLKSGEGQQAIGHLLKTLEPVDEKTPGYMRELAGAYRKVGDEARARYYYQRSGGENQAAGAGSLGTSKDVQVKAGAASANQP